MPHRGRHRRCGPPDRGGGAVLIGEAATEGPRHLDLAFGLVEGRTALTRRLHAWPYAVGRVFPATDGDLASVIVQSGSGGIITGDRLRQRLTVGPGARAQVHGQGAVSVHRRGVTAGSGEELELVAAENAWLESLAEPRLLFDGSDFVQRTDVDLAGGTVLSVEAVVVLGSRVSYASSLEIRDAGAPVGRERLRLCAGDLPRDTGAFGLVLCAGPGAAAAAREADREWRGWSRTFGSPRAYGAVSELPFGVGVTARIVAADGQALREAVAGAVEILRAARGGRSPA